MYVLLTSVASLVCTSLVYEFEEIRHLNVDSNLNCLHLIMPFRTVERHYSAPIRVLCDHAL